MLNWPVDLGIIAIGRFKAAQSPLTKKVLKQAEFLFVIH